MVLTSLSLSLLLHCLRMFTAARQQNPFCLGAPMFFAPLLLLFISCAPIRLCDQFFSFLTIVNDSCHRLGNLCPFSAITTVAVIPPLLSPVLWPPLLANYSITAPMAWMAYELICASLFSTTHGGRLLFMFINYLARLSFRTWVKLLLLSWSRTISLSRCIIVRILRPLSNWRRFLQSFWTCFSLSLYK